MININLLPSELQRAARTPKALFFTVIGGVTATMLVGVGVVWLWMSVHGLDMEVEQLTLRVQSLEAEAAEVDRLAEDIALYKDRERAIIEIKSRRTFWGLKLHQLSRLTPEDVWVTRLTLDTLDEAEYKWDANQVGGSLVLRCFAKGTDVQTLTGYRDLLSERRPFFAPMIEDFSIFPDDFFAPFSSIAPPRIERVNLVGYEEPRCLLSDVNVAMRPRFERPQPEGKK